MRGVQRKEDKIAYIRLKLSVYKGIQANYSEQIDKVKKEIEAKQEELRLLEKAHREAPQRIQEYTQELDVEIANLAAILSGKVMVDRKHLSPREQLLKRLSAILQLKKELSDC